MSESAADGRTTTAFCVAVFLASAIALLAPSVVGGRVDSHLGVVGMSIVTVVVASMNTLASAVGFELGLALRRALVRRQASPRSRWVAFAYGVATVTAGFLLARWIRPHGIVAVAVIFSAVSVAAGLAPGRVTTSVLDRSQ